MSKFRKKPVVIEAHQWDGTVGSADVIAAWAGVEDCDPKKDQLGRISRDRVEQIGQFAPLTVHSLEGDMTAQPNDWVIRGVKGEFYPCKPDLFAATYEPESVPAPAGEVPNERLAEQTWGCDHEIVTLAREALERVKALEAALQNVCAHTGHLPGADRELLVALLAKCQTIALGALGAPRPEEPQKEQL